jgi:hypothetical protein
MAGKYQTINLESFDHSMRVRLRAGREVTVKVKYWEHNIILT